jgi:hypothetical protein
MYKFGQSLECFCNVTNLPVPYWLFVLDLPYCAILHPHTSVFCCSVGPLLIGAEEADVINANETTEKDKVQLWRCKLWIQL